MVESHEVAETFDTKTFYGQMSSIQTVFSFTRTVVIPCQLSAWPGKLDPFTDNPSTCGCQTGL